MWRHGVACPPHARDPVPQLAERMPPAPAAYPAGLGALALTVLATAAPAQGPLPRSAGAGHNRVDACYPPPAPEPGRWRSPAATSETPSYS